MGIKKHTTIIYILENLGFLLDSGLPLTLCIDILAKRSKNEDVLKIKDEILIGKTFSEAIQSIFGPRTPFVLKMFIQIGESCGKLGAMIKKGVEVDNFIKKINSSFVGAISYPLFICFIAIIMMLLTMIGIIPKLIPMFRDLHIELPIYTRFFIFISNAIVKYGFYVLVMVIISISVFVYYFRKSINFRIRLENLTLKTWGLGILYKRYHASIIALCISEYIKTGYSLHESIKLVGNSTHSFAFKTACVSISHNLQSGMSLFEAVNLNENLLHEWSHVLDIASQTGRLAEQFERFYVENLMYLERTNNQIKRWSEPALMLFIGVLIAVFAVSIISPIYSVVQNVRI